MSTKQTAILQVLTTARFKTSNQTQGAQERETERERRRGSGGVDAGNAADMEKMLKIKCRLKGERRERAGSQKERERGKGYRGGCCIQDPEN